MTADLDEMDRRGTGRRRKLSAILMADVSGFSRMMGANEAETIDRIQGFQSDMRRLVEEFEGRVVDTAGDSVLAEFDSVVNAVACARRVQADGNVTLAARIGIHLGDVIVEDYRVYGDGVNIAARLESLADPGGICISEAVYREVRNKLDVEVQDLGLRELKNIEHPLRLYKVPPARPAAKAQVAPRHAEVPVAGGRWLDELTHPMTLVPACVSLFLVMSETLLFPTAGVLPTLGAILFAVVAGRASQRRGGLLVALGVGIASGALWTDWSRVTNTLFVLVGVIVSAVGVGSATRKA